MSNSKTEKWDIVWIKISTNKLVKEYRVIKSLTTLYIIGKSLPSLHQHCPFCEEESVQNMDILDLLLDLHPGRMTVEWSHTLTWWTLGQDWCFLSLSGQVKHFTVTELYLPLKSNQIIVSDSFSFFDRCWWSASETIWTTDWHVQVLDSHSVTIMWTGSNRLL